jgi:hypothetical protein
MNDSEMLNNLSTFKKTLYPLDLKALDLLGRTNEDEITILFAKRKTRETRTLHMLEALRCPAQLPGLVQ